VGHRYFYDLPVYRLARDAYYKARDEYIDNVLFPPGSPHLAALRAREKDDPNANTAMRDHLERSYGGCWEFNEIIGHIRLHFLGSQVRGEYFAVAKSRIVRTRTKTFEYRTWKLAPEVEIEPPYGQVEILSAVRSYIEDCRRAVPRRFIDTTMFEAVAPHLDWPLLLR
jgi:hypothetical protein